MNDKSWQQRDQNCRRISQSQPCEFPPGAADVYSLYVVGAELGVLNLLPAVGQLCWGGGGLVGVEDTEETGRF